MAFSLTWSAFVSRLSTSGSQSTSHISLSAIHCTSHTLDTIDVPSSHLAIIVDRDTPWAPLVTHSISPPSPTTCCAALSTSAKHQVRPLLGRRLPVLNHLAARKEQHIRRKHPPLTVTETGIPCTTPRLTPFYRHRNERAISPWLKQEYLPSP